MADSIWIPDIGTSLKTALSRYVSSSQMTKDTDVDQYCFRPGQLLKDIATDVLATDVLKESGEGFTAAEAKERLALLSRDLFEAQSKLYANGKKRVLLVLQGMDTSGKDGLIRHVFRYVNPVGLRVYSFGPPSELEAQEHFLARYRRALPPLGFIGVFNRSYYEQLMYVRVHPEVRREPVNQEELDAELRSVLEFEKSLIRSGVHIVKVFLHISQEQQRRRLLARANNPKKYWKLQAADLIDRSLWSEHYEVFQNTLTQTTFDAAPWYVVPADQKWHARYVVARLLVDALIAMAPAYPQPDQAKQQLIRQVRKRLGD